MIFILIINKQLTNNLQATHKQLTNNFLATHKLRIMVCSQCSCSGHNKRTCLSLVTISLAEQRVVAELSAILPAVKVKKVVAAPVKKVFKAIEGLADCKNIWKEPKADKVKKVSKPLEGLVSCKNIWKEPKVTVTKKVSKPLEGLTGCKNIWKEPKVAVTKKVSKPLEGLVSCKNIWKEPKSVYLPKTRKVNRSEFRVAKSLIQMIQKDNHLNGVGILSL